MFLEKKRQFWLAAYHVTLFAIKYENCYEQQARRREPDLFKFIFASYLQSVVQLKRCIINCPIKKVYYYFLCNNQINARALIGQLAMVYCADKPTEKSRVFWIII